MFIVLFLNYEHNCLSKPSLSQCEYELFLIVLYNEHGNSSIELTYTYFTRDKSGKQPVSRYKITTLLNQVQTFV